MKTNPDELLLLSRKVDLSFPSPALYQALRIATYNEQKIEAFLSLVIEKHGPQPPFSEFSRPAGSHTQPLLSLLTDLHVVTPVNDWKAKLTVPGSIQECCELSVAMELETIQMYDQLIPHAVKPEIRDVFYRLQADSFNHRLPAFREFASHQATGTAQNPASNMGNATGGSFIDTLLDTFAETVDDPAQKEVLRVIKQGSSADKGRILGGLVQSLLAQATKGNSNP